MRQNILTMTVVLGVAGALAAVVFGGGLALFVALGASGAFAEAGQSPLLFVAVAVAAGVVAPVLALLAAWHGWRGLRGEASPAFRLPGWGWFLLALIVTLAAGQAAFSAGLNGVAVVAHVLVAALAALLMLAIPVGAARRHGWSVGRRAGATSVAWGGLGGVGLAITLEMVLAGGLLLLLVVAVAVLRPELLEQFGGATPGPLMPDADPMDMLTPLLSSPLVLLGGLLVIAVIVPLIEELAKSLAVPVARWAGRPLTRIDAFLLGAACGAGFTLIEGITNGATALAQPQGWAVAMTARSGVAVIHVLASALAGLAWQAGLVERNWRRGAGLFLAAVALHGAWNGGALIVAWLGLRGMSGGIGALPGNLGAFVVVLGMGAVFVGSLIGLAVLPGRLIQRR